MKIDIRTEAAKYYDSSPNTPNDIPFYQQRIPSLGASVLELGCGTGRVTLPLIPYCHYIHGIDISQAMLSVCREKLARAGVPPAIAQVAEGDITNFELNRAFDFIIAPFRVLQNLETDAEVDRLFQCIRRHLAPGGSCILNVFRPYLEPHDLRQQWLTNEEGLEWEAQVEGGRLACYSRRARIDPEKLILYPELIYRRYEGEMLAEESVLKLVMRCYFPDAFEKLVLHHGFAILNRWGGYEGEVYGQGPELVIQFQDGS